MSSRWRPTSLSVPSIRDIIGRHPHEDRSMNHEELLGAIEKRYSFQLPAAYRQAVLAGWIDTDTWEQYTPMCLGEWLRLEAILEFDFQSVDPDTPVNPGLIPFAQSPGGDPYCWYPARTIQGEAAAGECEFGQYDRIRLDAPSLLGFVYRDVLDQLATGGDDYEIKSAQRNLARWRQTWFPLFPQQWQQTLAAMPDSPCVQWTRTLKSGYQEKGRSFLHPDERDKIVTRDLGFEGINQTVILRPRTDGPRPS
jgi:hypothetical protein